MARKVLLVDDVRLFLQLEETFFKRTGCEIFTATCGEEALSQAEKHSPDLILLDYIMPDMMGDEVCRRLRGTEWGKSIPIIVVSTSADGKDVERCFEAGANDYVTKPIDPQEVLGKAAEVLNLPARIHFRIMVNLEIVGQSPEATFTGFSRNLSKGGILVECDQQLKPETGLLMNLPLLDGGQSLAVKGSVIRADEGDKEGSYMLGIKFQDVDAIAQAAIDSFIDVRKPKATF